MVEETTRIKTSKMGKGVLLQQGRKDEPMSSQAGIKARMLHVNELPWCKVKNSCNGTHKPEKALVASQRSQAASD